MPSSSTSSSILTAVSVTASGLSTQLQVAGEPAASASSLAPATSAAVQATCPPASGATVSGGQSTHPATGLKSKSARKWESWTQDDMKWFFEALCEHGKDFHQIQAYMAQRSEKSRVPAELIKNREQVRHYYYRIGHKVVNSLNISDDVDRQVQEIYGLINYGEIWKKFGPKFDSKVKQHLNELVLYGQTICKLKGKNVKLKTPVCKALKKLHGLSDSNSGNSNNACFSGTLPKEVHIEFHPANNAAWIRVHSMAQNPRVRTRVSLQKRLSSLIAYLEVRWSSSRRRKAESVAFAGDGLKLNGVDEFLRIYPQAQVDLNPILIKKTKSSNMSSADLSLNAFVAQFKGTKVKKKKNDEPKQTSNNKSIADSSKEQLSDKSTDDINAEEMEEVMNENSNQPYIEAQRSLSLLSMLTAQTESEDNQTEIDAEVDEDEEEFDEDENDITGGGRLQLPVPPANATLSEWLSRGLSNHKGVSEEACVDSVNIAEKMEEDEPRNASSTNEVVDHVDEIINDIVDKKDDLLEKSLDLLKRGWTRDSADLITIGEVYMMFRCPGKLVFEYKWENATANEASVTTMSETASCGKSLLEKLVTAANLSLVKHRNKKEDVEDGRTGRRTKGNKKVKTCTGEESVTSTSQKPATQLNLSQVISSTILTDSPVKQVAANQCDPGMWSRSENLDRSHVQPIKACNKSKNKLIAGDPLLIQEALKQLQSHKLTTRKQRKLTPKVTIVPFAFPPPPSIVAEPAVTLSIRQKSQTDEAYNSEQQQLSSCSSTTAEAMSTLYMEVIEVVDGNNHDAHHQSHL